MKKNCLFSLFILLFAGSMLFAQSNSTVDLDDEAYEILAHAETQGLCTTLKNEKPYTENYILQKLEEIAGNLTAKDTWQGKTELSIVRQTIERLTTKESSLPALQFVTSNNNDNLPLQFGVYYTIEGMMSGGLYQRKDVNSFGFEEWNTLGFFGNFGKNVSFDWDGGIAFTKMPLVGMDKEGESYHIGSWWNETGGYDKTDSVKYPVEHLYSDRFIHTYKNYSVLPYHYVKHWDGSIYNLDKFHAGGLLGWPNALSFGMTMMGGIEASFFNNRLYLGVSRKYREWGAMEEGASLTLNSNARPFLGMEASFKVFDWLSFSALTGFLEFPNNEDIRNAWYIPEEVRDENGKVIDVVHGNNIPSTRDSFFFQNMFAINQMNFDFKYFHFDFGSTCIFPKRFELGYMFPIFEKIVFQNSIGDYDNLGLFGTLAGRYPGLGTIWLSAYIDEINVPNIKTMFNDTRCMFALQAGVKSVFPLLPFGQLSFRYTKVEPYCYTHPAVKEPYHPQYVSTAYINNGSPLGYYLDPNSDEFFLRIEGKPLTNLDVGMQYQLIRHGATWGDHSVEGSSIYSELEHYGREDHHKYFLKDGAYEWTNMVMIDASYDLRSHNLPMQFSASIGYIYDFFTVSGKYNEPADMRIVDSSDPLYSLYPTTTGVVLSLGFKFFTF